jgi:DNA primase
MSYDIQEIKDRITIPEMLQKIGVECPIKLDCMIKSPVREERTPSFHIYDQGKRGHDFGGDFKGDVIDLYQAIHGCKTDSAIAVVAEFAGVSRQEKSSRSLHAPIAAKRKAVVTTEHERWTDDRTKFAEEACSRNFKDAMSTDINELMVRKGWNFKIIHQLRRQGVLGFDKDGKVLYIYPHGVKKRWSADDSRGDRWVWGKAKDNLWRGNALMDPQKTNLFLSEGETDLITFLRHREEAENELSCSVPGASWSPTPVECYRIASHRDVYLMFDCDDAGFELTKRISTEFGEHATNCNVHALSWKKILREVKPEKKNPDLGDVMGKLKEKIDNYFIIV